MNTINAGLEVLERVDMLIRQRLRGEPNQAAEIPQASAIAPEEGGNIPLLLDIVAEKEDTANIPVLTEVFSSDGAVTQEEGGFPDEAFVRELAADIAVAIEAQFRRKLPAIVTAVVQEVLSRRASFLPGNKPQP